MRLLPPLLSLFLTLLSIGASSQTIQTIAGKGTMAFNGDNGPAIRASFYHPTNLAWDDLRKILYISDIFNSRIRVIDSNGFIHSLDSLLQYPAGLALDSNGDLYAVSSGERRVYKYPRAGGRTLIAGNGNNGYNGDGIPATSAALSPLGLAFDVAGNLLIADAGNHRIRKINSAGIISTVAGTGISGYNGDGIAATSATIGSPAEVIVDKSGNLYILERLGCRIRKVNTSGVISTVAGKGTPGYTGDNGRADSARINYPRSFAMDSSGNIYLADAGNYCVRMIDTSGIITTIAGTDSSGFYGDGGSPTAALFNQPFGLAIGNDQSLLICDGYNERIRKICPARTVTTSMKIKQTHSGTAGGLDTVTFRAVFTPRAAGVLYKWRLNGGLVSTDSVFTNPWAALTDTVTVEVTAYNLCTPFFRDTALVTPLNVPATLQQPFPISVYPNPAATNIMIEAKDIPGECTIVLTDIQGRAMLSKQIQAYSHNNTDLSSIAVGTYYLKIYHQHRLIGVRAISHY